MDLNHKDVHVASDGSRMLINRHLCLLTKFKSDSES